MTKRAKLRMTVIVILLFSISLIPENIGFNFEFELRPLFFAILICSLIVRIGLLDWWKDGKLENHLGIPCHTSLIRRGIKNTSIDVVYISCVLLTIISFVTKSQSINAFHFVFVAVGMFVVYFVVRTANLDEILLQSKIIYSVIGIGFIVAVIGLVQLAMGKSLVSTFGRTSYLGCFLAMNAAISFGLLLATRNVPLKSNRLSVIGNRFLRLFSLLAFVVILGATVLTKSRSAMIALAVVLPIIIIGTKTLRLKENQKSKVKLYKRKGVKFILYLGVLVVVFLMFAGGRVAYKLRPMSASGRVLIWKVSAEMFKKNPITGVGFGNFANTYNFYQANYFASGKGSVVNKMTAGQIRHAYNWYLETAAEFGIFGLIVFGIFWWLILAEVYKVYFPRTTDYVNLGMSGAVLCFMIMSLFQFPRKIIPTYLMFNFALAWIVNANLETQKSQETQKENL